MARRLEVPEFDRAAVRMVSALTSSSVWRHLAFCLASVWFFFLKMSKNRGNKTRFARRTSLFRIGLVGLPLFKCDEIRLRWGFTSSEKYLWIHNRALSTLNRSPWRKFYVGERFSIIYFQRFSLCVLLGLVEKLWPGAVKVLSSITGGTWFSFTLLLFFYSFTFSFLLGYCSCFVSLYSQSFLDL